MNIILNFMIIISICMLVFIGVPGALYLLYMFSDLYSKFYLKLIGQEKEWYQKMFFSPLSLYYGWRYKKLRSKLKLDGRPYIAIILANNYFPEKYSPFSIDSINKLVKYLRENKKPYRVYERVNINEVRRIINNRDVSSVFLFGHGQRHGIKLGRDEMLYYCEFDNHPKKDLIAQFHCNHLKGKSLADYGLKPRLIFIKNGIQKKYGIDKQISHIIKEKLI